MRIIKAYAAALWTAFFLIGAVLGPGCDCNDDDDTPPETGERVRTSATLVAFDSCQDLETALKQNLSEEMKAYLLSLDEGTFYGVPEGGDVDEAAPASEDGGRQEGLDYSGTNVQEAGVDEADFVKTDGYSLYVLNGSTLVIMDVPVFGRLEEQAALDLEGYPVEMLLSKDNESGRAVKAVVFSTIYTAALPEDHPLYEYVTDTAGGDFWYYPSTVLTKLTVIDLDDPADPQVMREIYLEGYYQTARRVTSSVHMIAYSTMEVPGLVYWPELPEQYYNLEPDDPRRQEMWDEAIAEAIAHNEEVIAQLALEDLVPMIYKVQGAEVTTHDFTAAGCANFAIAEDGMSRGYTSLFSFDLLDAGFSFDADHIVSNWSLVYASADTLLIAEPAQDWWWYYDTQEYDEATNIHRFAISPDGRAAYTGSGRVDGTVLNQFSLSEYDDYIRVAATTGQWNRWWEENPPPPENHVYVLSGEDNLTIVGQVDGIALGEQIWSARFIEERGYLVTFRNVDPLWTIDLSDPEHPRIMGELEVPGVSTYIHPLGDTRLLTIGYGGDDERLDGSLQVTLFDVSDFDNPEIIDKPLTLFAPGEGQGWSTWAWSEAAHEHKAFQYWAPKKMLAVPLSTSRYVYSGGDDKPGEAGRRGQAASDNDTGQTGEGDDYHYEYISMLTLVSVDNETGLAWYGDIDHSGFYNSDPYAYWCSQDVRRSIFMGDYIYTVSDRAVTVNNLDNMTSTATVMLPGSDCEMYYW